MLTVERPGRPRRARVSPPLPVGVLGIDPPTPLRSTSPSTALSGRNACARTERPWRRAGRIPFLIPGRQRRWQDPACRNRACRLRLHVLRHMSPDPRAPRLAPRRPAANDVAPVGANRRCGPPSPQPSPPSRVERELRFRNASAPARGANSLPDRGRRVAPGLRLPARATEGGGAGEDRTADLLSAIQALPKLS